MQRRQKFSTKIVYLDPEQEQKKADERQRMKSQLPVIGGGHSNGLGKYTLSCFQRHFICDGKTKWDATNVK